MAFGKPMLALAASRVVAIASLPSLLLPSEVAGGMVAVHPVLFPGSAHRAERRQQNQQPPPPPLVVFLHGRLESDSPADDGRRDDAVVPRPAELYGDFCRGLAERIPPGGGGGGGSAGDDSPPAGLLVLPEFDGLYGEMKREPRDLRLGPLSAAVGETIREQVAMAGEGEDRKIVAVSYSMGAAILLKLLRSDPAFASAVERLVLLEPVWRCWLPFAVSKPEAVSAAPAVALFGTDDELTRDDSGRSVLGSLRPFLPNLEVVSVEGGNHWGIMSDGVDVASDGLPPGRVASEVRSEMIDHVCSFCGWA